MLCLAVHLIVASAGLIVGTGKSNAAKALVTRRPRGLSCEE